MFSVGTVNVKIFKYLGLDVTQNNKHLDLNEEELKSFRALIGQLLWVSNQTRPDVSFNLSELSGLVNHATVEHILRANKVLKMPKSNQSL